MKSEFWQVLYWSSVLVCLKLIFSLVLAYKELFINDFTLPVCAKCDAWCNFFRPYMATVWHPVINDPPSRIKKPRRIVLLMLKCLELCVMPKLSKIKASKRKKNLDDTCKVDESVVAVIVTKIMTNVNGNNNKYVCLFSLFGKCQLMDENSQ